MKSLFVYGSRKRRSQYSGLLLLGVTLVLCCKEQRPDGNLSEPKPPNILFIAIDDLNDWVGCLKGHPQASTPNIDRLAARGTLFTNAHAQSPICNPSRTSVLTGLRPSTTGIYGLSPWIREVDSLKNIQTLPQYFSEKGYTTLSAGKIYHGGYGRRQADVEFDVLGPPSGVRKRPPEKLIGPTPGGNNPWMDWGTFELKEEETSDWEVASWAVKTLDNPPEEPFFLSVGFFLPHVPLYTPEHWYDRFPDKTLIMPPIHEEDRADTPRFSWYNHWDVPEPRLKWVKETGNWRSLVRAYLAATSFMDHQLGRVLDALEASGLQDNTVVVLWSDHGYHLGEKEVTGKNTLWEPSTRVPLIFAGPGIGSGAVCDSPVELLDIYPTLAELSGFAPREHLEGHSLLPQLGDPMAPRPWPAITTNNYNNHAVRTDRWRYIRYANNSSELYDMREDPEEWHNLLSENTYDDLVRELEQWLPKENKAPHIGNGQRILQFNEGEARWQGKIIDKSAPIPGIVP